MSDNPFTNQEQVIVEIQNEKHPQFKHTIQDNPQIQKESTILIDVDESISEIDAISNFHKNQNDKILISQQTPHQQEYQDGISDLILNQSANQEGEISDQDASAELDSSKNELIQRKDVQWVSQNSIYDLNKEKTDNYFDIVIKKDQEKQFLKIEIEEEVKPIYEHSYYNIDFANRSLFIFDKKSFFRQKILAIVQSGYFEQGMILIICINSLSLACYDYSDRDSKTKNNQVIDKINFVFTIIFIIEAAMRIIATGLILSENSYLRSGWNVIDAAVVVSGLAEMAFRTMNLKSIRVVRVFRPLKTINAIKSMKQLIQALISSIPDFANVTLFLAFVFILFATLGLHQYNGVFYNACRYSPEPESPTEWLADVSSERVCSISELGSYMCPAGQYCRNPSDSGNYSYQYENMNDRWYVNYGITNFDNLGRSLLTVFQIVTSDTWFQQMCNLMDVDIPIFGALYVLILMVIGQFFLMNLILAVIIFAFIKSQKETLQLEVEAYHQTQKLKQEEIRESTTRREAEIQSHEKKIIEIIKHNTIQSRSAVVENEVNDFKVFLKSKAQERMVANMFQQAKSLQGVLKAPKKKSPEEALEEHMLKIPPEGSSLGNVLQWAKEKKRLESLMPKNEQDNQIQGGQMYNQDKEETLFEKLFKQYIEKKIENEYDSYFKNILKEAQEISSKANMREVVGIKVGLEYMRQQQMEKERNIEEKRSLNDRKSQSKIYLYAYKVHSHYLFKWFIIFAIVANTFVLSLDKYPIDLKRIFILEKLNFVFTAIFVIEILVNLIAFGFKRFFKGSWFNIFDLIIVLGSLIDIIVSYSALNLEHKKTGSVITSLRGFRLLRVFKLARSWKRFELLLDTLGSTLKDVASFSILLFLFIFIYTLLGLELFAFKAKLDPDTNYVDPLNGVSPTFNFDTFLNSFSLVFIFLTNDGTSAIYYNFYRSVNAFSSSVYFISLVVIGQKIILNLFVAILLENFDEGVLKQKMHDYEESQRGVANKEIGWAAQKWTQFKEICICIVGKVQTIETVRPNQDSKKEGIVLKLGLLRKEKQSFRTQSVQLESEDEEIILDGRPLFIIPSDFFLREIFGKILLHPYYDNFIILVIFISVIQLALDNPLVDPSSAYARSIFWLDAITTAIFIADALFKIITFGFQFNGQRSYFRSFWNKLDLVIIIFSILAMKQLPHDFKTFEVLRIFRLISLSSGLKAALRALIQGFPNIINVTIIMLLFFLIFGVISVSQFKGLFFSCSENQETPNDLQSKWDCLNAGGLWENNIYNFDDIPNAMVTLFVMATTAGWQDILMLTITSTKEDYIAHEERSTFWSLYYIMFMIVGFFFFLNLFVGVVVTNFQTEKDKIGGNDLLTEQQREWIDLKLLVLRSAPIRKIMPPKNNTFRMLFFKIESAKWFENFIFTCILLNTILLMLKWYQQSEQAVIILEFFNYAFTGIFMSEAIIKIIAQSPQVFFKDNWNRFDLIIAVASCFSIIIAQTSSIRIKGTITLMRSFRILRLLRLLKRGGKSLHMIFNTFVITLSSLRNVGALLILIIYMYSVLGMILFGRNMRTGLMNHWMNFEDFINSFLVLFTVTTGDSWNAFQTSFVVYPSPLQQCLWNPTYQDYLDAGMQTVGCSSKPIAYAFFVSFYFLVSLIFLQLFIAVILQGYDDTQVQESRLFNNEINTTFRETWADFDEEATTFINISQLRGFLFKLGAPLGFDEIHKENKFMQDRFIASLDLPTYYDFSKYQFLDVLDGLSFRLMVLDHMKNDGESISPMERKQTFIERKTKEQLEKEVNKLIYSSSNEAITAVQDVVAKEMSQKRKKEPNKCGLTSTHHMVAEATIRKWRLFISLSKKDRADALAGEINKQRSLQKNWSKTEVIKRKEEKQTEMCNKGGMIEEEKEYEEKGAMMKPRKEKFKQSQTNLKQQPRKKRIFSITDNS